MLATALALVVSCASSGGSERPDEPGQPKAVSEPAKPPVAEVEKAAQVSDAAGGKRVWGFDDVEPGAAAPGFSAEVGQWAVASDSGAPSGERVLAQTAKSPGPVYNVVLAQDGRYRDVDISVQLRAVAGKVDQGGGPVWRARDAENYYIARYNPLEDNYRVYVVEGGRRRMLKSAAVKLDHAAWHQLRVVMKGDAISCFLDGAKQLEATDATFPDAGMVGLWTKADAVTHFDDLSYAAGPGAEGVAGKPSP